MDWPTDGVTAFFLVCFFIGLLYTVAAFFLGLGHDGASLAAAPDAADQAGLHLDHLHLGSHGGGHGLLAGGHGGGDHGALGGSPGHGTPDHSPAGVGAGHSKPAATEHGPSPLNLTTLMAFLTWFGGVGYIARAYSTLWLVAVLGIAILFGLLGAALVFLFLRRILFASQWVLDPSEFRLPGTLARVSVPIRPSGTGEIIYSKAGTRHVASARSFDEQLIERNTEVVIMRYVGGIAYVQPWARLLDETPNTAVERPPPSATT